MSSNPSNSEMPDDFSGDEQLVAYLDGELSGDESRAIQQLLAENPAARQRLYELQHTWDLLGKLERCVPNRVSRRARWKWLPPRQCDDVRQSQAVGPPRWRRWLPGVLLALGAALAGFLAVAWLWPNPNRQWLADRPIVENLDAYRHVADIRFLKMLSQEHLFDQDRLPADEPRPAATVEEEDLHTAASGSRPWMPRGNSNCGSWMPPLRTRRSPRTSGGDWALRTLHDLNSYRREELVGLEPEDRLARVKTLLNEQAQEESKRLKPEEAAALWDWMEHYAAKRAERLAEKVPPERSKHLAEMSPSDRNRTLFGLMWYRWQLGGGKRGPLFTETDLAEMSACLSPQTRQRLDALPPEQRRAMLLGLGPALDPSAHWPRGPEGCPTGSGRRRVDAVFRANADQIAARSSTQPAA